MEQKKSTGGNTAYTGRFGESTASRPGSASASPRKSLTGAQRRPAGFGAAQSTPNKKPAAKPAPEKKSPAPKKEKKVRQPRPPREKKAGCGLKALLVVSVILLMLFLLIVLIFGGEDQTYHQMPTIERENIASFAPIETPLPGAEVS